MIFKLIFLHFCYQREEGPHFSVEFLLNELYFTFEPKIPNLSVYYLIYLDCIQVKLNIPLSQFYSI